jgi:hypothetical protein
MSSIKTPIIFTLESLVEDEVDPPVPIPDPVTPENELDLILKPLYLASRYYLIIKPPSEIRNDTSYISKSFTYHIPWEGIYKNQVRVALPPTIGWGEGSCYEVEYWEWRPHILPKIYKIPPLKHKLLKTEHWLVPHPTGKYMMNYNYLQSKFKPQSISLVSTGSPLSIAAYNDVLVTTTINTDITNYTIASVIGSNTSLIQRAVNYKNTTDVLLTNTIPANTTFTLNYVKPVDIKQVLFKNSEFPQNIYTFPAPSSFIYNRI